MTEIALMLLSKCLKGCGLQGFFTKNHEEMCKEVIVTHNRIHLSTSFVSISLFLQVDYTKTHIENHNQAFPDHKLQIEIWHHEKSLRKND